MQAKLHPITQTDRELRRSIKRLEAYQKAHADKVKSVEELDLWFKIEKLVAGLKDIQKYDIPDTYRDVTVT